VAAGQRRHGQRTGGLPAGRTPGGRLLAVLKSVVPRSAVLKSVVPKPGDLKSSGGRPGTGRGPPAGHPVRRHRPVLRGTGHRARRDPAAGRRPGWGRPDAGGNLPRRDLRPVRQPPVRRPRARQPDRCPLVRGRPHGPQSCPGRPDRCPAHGGRWSAGCHRGCGRGRAGRCSRRYGRLRLPVTLPAMTCVACPGRSGGSRCGTRPAGPPGKRPCPVRHRFPGGLQSHGRQTIAGSHPFPAALQSHARLQCRGWHQFHGRQTIPVAHRYHGRHQLHEPDPFRVRPPLRCPGRGDSRPGCRSAPHLSPGSANWTLPGRAARAPRRAGYLRCWPGGPCFRRPRPVRYRPGLGHYRGAGPFQCRRRARGRRRPYGHDQRRRWGGPGSAVLRRPGSGRAPRRRIGRRPGPARLPRSVLRSS
jgi:hypothetical protein